MHLAPGVYIGCLMLVLQFCNCFMGFAVVLVYVLFCLWAETFDTCCELFMICVVWVYGLLVMFDRCFESMCANEIVFVMRC